jgi:hypothetical protein
MVKFVEIVAAGLATAVSGYLIAHLSGVLSSPVPVSGALSSPVPVPAQAVNQAPANASPPAEPPSSISGDLGEQHPSTKGTASPSPSAAPRPARPVNSAKSALPRKHTETATGVAESKRDQESLVARVRDALTNVDTSRTAPPAVPAGPVAPAGDIRLDPTSPMVQPQPSAGSARGAVTGTAPPNPSEVRPLPAQAPQLDPLTAVEIQSRPVAAAQPSPPPPAETETGIISTLEQMLRHDPLTGSEEAPRPPMPVGQ